MNAETLYSGKETIGEKRRALMEEKYAILKRLEGIEKEFKEIEL